MNDLIKRLLASVTALWAKWTIAQKIIVFGIAAAALAAVIFVFSFSSRPAGEPLFNTPITDQSARDSITLRLDKENISYTVNAAGIITVSDQAAARRARMILYSEGLVPGNTDPWNLFDMKRWTVSDFENNVNLRRSIERQLTQHIEALDDIDKASVVVTMPKTELFEQAQKPVTASVSIMAKPNSGIYEDRKKIQGIQRLIMFAVEGLTEDNIVITDSRGIVLNDFEDMKEFDLAALTEKHQKIIANWESDYKKKILSELQQIYSPDRVRVVGVKVEMDMSKAVEDSETYSPVTIRDDNPDTPYDDSEYKDNLVLEAQTTTKKWTGTSLLPEGPAGTDGQNPPVYADMNTMVGTSEETSVTQKNLVNKKITHSERSPTPGRVTVSVAIDGTWKEKYDDNGREIILANGAVDREYIPVPAEDIEKAVSLVQNAIGYSQPRKDSVTVTNVQFDRTAQFRLIDSGIMQKMQMRRTIYMMLGGLAAVLVAFMVFRFISKERERRRRLKEEELLRKRQMERDKTLWDAEQGAVEVTMSVEERRRAELQENAIAAAKEHPEDVAQLIRTWLMEE
ncbi:MAG: flagellar basal-body MS-ring/collar protein FliF [Treponemataceae bacterium]|nr:MAG: flagellar basal-body MS-ring/collar protein FliF [Treponemataceae bacterium]